MNKVFTGGLIGVMVLATAGCGGGSQSVAASAGVSVPPARASASASPGGPATISVTPASGAKGVAPDAEVSVGAVGAKLTEVRVEDSDGHDLVGATTPDGTAWHATAPVRVGENYAVDAWAVGPDGKQIEKTSSFATRSVPASRTLQIASVTPNNGSTVGVAQPLVVSFESPVSDRKLVQAALQVTTTPHVDGAWYWIDDSHVHFRPQNFWPAHTTVQLDAKLSGVSAGGGAVGGNDSSSSFTVGRDQEIQVNTHRHKLTVERDGQTVRTFDASTGKPGWETRDGTEVMIDRVKHKHWTNTAIGAKKHFSLYSKYAIRITNSGEFVHDAPWATGSLGEENTSHGCIGLKTKDMAWIWDNSLMGDPVVVTGSSRQHQDLGNTYDDWNVDWATWSHGDT